MFPALGRALLKNFISLDKIFFMKLPLLDYTSELFKKTNFDNVLLIAIQHILETNLVMFEYLFAKGLKPQNVFLLGKCYSTNKEILEKFQKKGVYVHDGSLKFNSHLSFDSQFESEIKDFYKTIVKKVNFADYEKVLIVDDGAMLLYSENPLIESFSNFIGIEQTSSGYNKIKKIKLKFPVINVARSDAKLVHESPFIAEKVIENIYIAVEKLKLKPQRALVVGAGSIGRAIHNSLKNKIETHIYDVRRLLSEFGQAELDNIICDFDLIIGASGSEILNDRICKKLKKYTILASASLSDREFSAVNLRKQVPKIENCHEDVFVNNVWLLNCGFPVDFDGKKNIVSPPKIQLTRALMFSAMCLAMEREYPSKKLIELDPKIQKQLIERFCEIKQAWN